VDKAEILEANQEFITFYEKLGQINEIDFLVILSTSEMRYESKLDLQDASFIDSREYPLQRLKHGFVDLSQYRNANIQAPKIYQLLGVLEWNKRQLHGRSNNPKTVIFVNDVRAAYFVTVCLLKRNYLASLMHDERHDDENKATYKRFRNRKLDILVCTDLKSLKFKFLVNLMINFNLPPDITNFIHRFQRVFPIDNGNATVLSFFDRAEDFGIAYQLKKFLEDHEMQVPDFIVNGYKKLNHQFVREMQMLDRQIRLFDATFS